MSSLILIGAWLFRVCVRFYDQIRNLRVKERCNTRERSEILEDPVVLSLRGLYRLRSKIDLRYYKIYRLLMGRHTWNLCGQFIAFHADSHKF